MSLSILFLLIFECFILNLKQVSFSFHRKVLEFCRLGLRAVYEWVRPLLQIIEREVIYHRYGIMGYLSYIFNFPLYRQKSTFQKSLTMLLHLGTIFTNRVPLALISFSKMFLCNDYHFSLELGVLISNRVIFTSGSLSPDNMRKVAKDSLTFIWSTLTYWVSMLYSFIGGLLK